MDLRGAFVKFKQKKEILKNTPKPVLIFDMMYLFRSQFSVQTITTESGIRLGGVGGSIRNIYSLIQLYNPSEVVCVFDGRDNAKQKQILDENYKSDRGQKIKMLKSPLSFNEEDAQEQMKLELGMLIKILRWLPIKMIEIVGLEADDIIGYLTKQYYPYRDKNTIIVSADKDFIQLIDERTKWYNSRKKIIVDLSNYHTYWNVPIENIIYIRAIEGDASDKLAGIKGIGAKTLLNLLPDIAEIGFKSIDDFIAHIKENSERLSKTKTGKLLLDSEEIIRTSYKIMQLSNPLIDKSQEKKILDIMEQNVYNLNNRTLLLNYLFENDLISVITMSIVNGFFRILKNE